MGERFIDRAHELADEMAREAFDEAVAAASVHSSPKSITRGSVTMRYDNSGLDELIVSKPTAFHLEYMQDNQVWMRVDREDGDSIVVVLTARGKIIGTTEED